MYIVRNFPTFESTKEYVVDFNSRVTGVFAIARTVEGNYRVEIVNEGAVPANSERRYVMSWVEPTPPPSLETMHKAWESDIDRRATESTETVAAESQDEEICWCKVYESCPACFGKK